MAKILLVKNRAIGDSVFGLSSLQYLKGQWPRAQITYALPQNVAQTYQKVEGLAGQVVGFNLKSLRGMIKFFHLALRGGWTAIIELQCAPRSFRLLRAASLWGRIPFFYHNHHLGHRVKTGIFHQGVRKAITQRDLDGVYSALGALGPTPTYPHYLDYPPKLPSPAPKDHSLVILGPGGQSPLKRWPAAFYGELTRRLPQSFSFLVPFSPSREDQRAKEEFLSTAAPRAQVLESPLEDLPAKLARGSYYIGNDTGVGHLSLALGARGLFLLGPYSEPLEWFPYRRDIHRYFWAHGHDVRTQMRELCLVNQFDSSRKISEISPEQVAREFMEQLVKTPHRPEETGPQGHRGSASGGGENPPAQSRPIPPEERKPPI